MMSQFDDSEGNQQVPASPGAPRLGSQPTNVLRGYNVAVRAGDFFKAFSTSKDRELEEAPTLLWESLNALARPERLRWKEQEPVDLSLCRAGEQQVVLFDFAAKDAARSFASGLPNVFQEQSGALAALLHLASGVGAVIPGLQHLAAQLDGLQLKPALETKAAESVSRGEQAGDGEKEGQSLMVQRYRERIKEEKEKMAARKVPSVDRTELAKAYRRLAIPLEPHEREEFERRMNREAAADEELE